ncbi:MAG: SulP family inorganic anion transporter [Planctomycetota bacterium]
MAPRLKRILPFLAWFEDRAQVDLRADFVAGLTVALVLIPQSMAYAQLAGLPAYYGLYAAFLPPMVASLFGSSRQLATGPVAVVSLMTAAALEPLATAGSAQYIQYAILLALMVGAFQLLLGVLRLGLVVNLLSHPVVNGFTCAAALIIATSQLSKIFGVNVDKAPHHYETVYRVVRQALVDTHWPTFAMAVLAIAIMAGLRRVNPRIPNVLVAVVVTTVLAWATGFDRRETVPLSAVHDPALAAAVEEYNSLLAEKEAVARLRKDSSRSLEELERETDLCIRCHTDLGGIDVLTAGTHQERVTSGRAALMHQKAGLLDDLLSRLEERETAVRERIRKFRLARGAAPGEWVPYGDRRAEDDPRWRVLVGNGALRGPAPDEVRLPLTSGGAVVGTIPPGLPGFQAPRLDWRIVLSLIPAGLTITILGFMEAISIAKAMAVRTRQRLDPNQELIGQGLANILGSLGQSYACSGSFSRSAVNIRAGAVSGLSNVFSSGVVVVVLLFLTRLLYHLPQAVLAAVIMMAVISLLNVRGFVHSWQTHRFDGLTGVASFAGTLVLAPHLEWGILLGVSLSVLGYIYRTMHSPAVALTAHSDGTFQDAKRHGLRQCEHLALIRFDGPMNFVTASYLQNEVLEMVAARTRLRHVLIAAHAVNEVDSSGVEMLRDLIERLRAIGLEFSISGIKDEAIGAFRRSHLYEVIGQEHLFSTQAQGIAAVYGSSHEGVEEAECPFRTVMPRTTELSLHPDGSLRDAHRHGLRRCDSIAVFRFDDAVNYANASFLEEAVRRTLRSRSRARYVVFAAHGIGDIDPYGARRLGELVVALREDGMEVSFSGLKDSVLDVLHAAGVYELIGERNVHPTQLAAIARVYGPAHRNGQEVDCPFAALIPRWTVLSLHPEGTMRSVERHGLAACDHVLVLRCDGAISLVDFEHLAESLQHDLRERPAVRAIVLDAHTLGSITDPLAAELFVGLGRVIDDGYRVVLAELPDPAAAVLSRHARQLGLGEDGVFPTVPMAIAWVYEEAHAGSREERCPLRPLLPEVIEVSLHPDGAYRNAKRHGLELCRHIAAVRFDGPIDYARGRSLEAQLVRLLQARPGVRNVLVLAHTIANLDFRAAAQIAHLVDRGRELGYAIHFSGFRDEVLDVLHSTGVLDRIGAEFVHPSAERAIQAIHPATHAGSREDRCPLLEVVRQE